MADSKDNESQAGCLAPIDVAWDWQLAMKGEFEPLVTALGREVTALEVSFLAVSYKRLRSAIRSGTEFVLEGHWLRGVSIPGSRRRPRKYLGEISDMH